MKCKKLISAVCAVVMAAGMAGVPAVGNVFGADTAISASAESLIKDDFEYEIKDDGTIKIKEYFGNATELYVPATLDGRRISEYYQHTFYNRKNLKKVTFEDSTGSVTMGDLMFQNCSNLEYVTLPKGLINIPLAAFKGCVSLKGFNIPDTVTSIGGATGFVLDPDCKVTELDIPSSVKTIGYNAFNGAKSLEKVTLHEGLETIDRTAFIDCYNIKEMYFPKSLKKLEPQCVGYSNSTSYPFYAKVEGFKMYVYKDSEAYKYATKNSFECHVHSFKEEVTTAATCTKAGVKKFTCDCGETYTESIPATGHEYNEEVIAPTTTAQGYTLHTCSKCKYSYKDNYTEKLPAPVATKTSISKATAKFSSTAVSYTGKSKMPKLTVTYGGKTLVKGKDYKVSGKNCKNPGKATITITGIGNYTGTKTMSFYIIPQKPTLTKATSTTKKKISLAWKKDSLADGYQIIVYSDKTCKTKVKSALVKKNSTVKGSLSGFTSGKTYYVRMRAYKTIDGKKKAGAFCAAKTVKVK